MSINTSLPLFFSHFVSLISMPRSSIGSPAIVTSRCSTWSRSPEPLPSLRISHCEVDHGLQRRLRIAEGVEQQAGDVPA